MRIASINFYSVNRRPYKDLALIRSLDIDSIGFQEAHKLDIITKRLTEHTVYKAKDLNTPEVRDVAVALTNAAKYIGHRGWLVSAVEPNQETRIMKERWMTIVRFRYKGRKYAHINYHGNAVVQNKVGGLLKGKRVDEWVKAAMFLENRIQSLRQRGFTVVVTGDFNYKRYPFVPSFVLSKWSPQRIFKRNDMGWVENKLDYVAWDKTLKRKKLITIPAHRTGSDHPWLIVDLEPLTTSR